jgi:hypothetical protein
MIFYGQDERQIIFLLDDPVTNAISDWNRHNHSQLELDDHEQQLKIFFPRFKITLHRELNQIHEIEIEQVHPKTKQGETFKQCFTAQESGGLCKLLSLMMHDFQHPRSKPPDYKPSLPILRLDLVLYSSLINDYLPGWTSETAFSNRFIYGFGELEITPGQWIEHYADGWIEDTEAGKLLLLYYHYPGEYM